MQRVLKQLRLSFREDTSEAISTLARVSRDELVKHYAVARRVEPSMRGRAIANKKLVDQVIDQVTAQVIQGIRFGDFERFVRLRHRLASHFKKQPIYLKILEDVFVSSSEYALINELSAICRQYKARLNQKDVMRHSLLKTLVVQLKDKSRCWEALRYIEFLKGLAAFKTDYHFRFIQRLVNTLQYAFSVRRYLMTREALRDSMSTYYLACHERLPRHAEAAPGVSKQGKQKARAHYQQIKALTHLIFQEQDYSAQMMAFELQFSKGSIKANCERWWDSAGQRCYQAVRETLDALQLPTGNRVITELRALTLADEQGVLTLACHIREVMLNRLMCVRRQHVNALGEKRFYYWSEEVKSSLGLEIKAVVQGDDQLKAMAYKKRVAEVCPTLMPFVEEFVSVIARQHYAPLVNGVMSQLSEYQDALMAQVTQQFAQLPKAFKTMVQREPYPIPLALLKIKSSSAVWLTPKLDESLTKLARLFQMNTVLVNDYGHSSTASELARLAAFKNLWQGKKVRHLLQTQAKTQESKPFAELDALLNRALPTLAAELLAQLRSLQVSRPAQLFEWVLKAKSLILQVEIQLAQQRGSNKSGERLTQDLMLPALVKLLRSQTQVGDLFHFERWVLKKDRLLGDEVGFFNLLYESVSYLTCERQQAALLLLLKSHAEKGTLTREFMTLLTHNPVKSLRDFRLKFVREGMQLNAIKSTRRAPFNWFGKPNQAHFRSTVQTILDDKPHLHYPGGRPVR